MSGARGPRHAGFTIVELLVVIVLMVIMMVIAIPSITSMVASAESSLAQERLSGAIRAANAEAVKSAGDRDVALVFFFDRGGPMTLTVCVKAGEIDDLKVDPISGSEVTVRREVFAPIPGVQSVSLPRGWVVRAYAPPASIDTRRGRGGWYEPVSGTPPAGGSGNGREYESNTAGHWVFPETGFYDVTGESTDPVPTSGGDLAKETWLNRQTFMVRFRAGSGELVMAPLEPALVLDPRPALDERPVAGDVLWQRPDFAPDPVWFVRTAIGNASRGPEDPTLRDVLGDGSGDTVLARPVSLLALLDEFELARDLRATVDRDSGSLLRYTDVPEWVASARFTPADVPDAIRRWIEGDTNFDGEIDRLSPDERRGDRAGARVFSIDSFTGEPKRVEWLGLTEVGS